MTSLLRTPLLRFLLRLWWLPTLAPVAVWGFWEPLGPHLAATAGIFYLGTMAALLGPAWFHAALTALRERARHRRAKHEFLCPHCLHFGPFLFGCSNCRREIPPFLVHTGGTYDDACPHCDATLFHPESRAPDGVRAHCRRCWTQCDLDPYHGRKVRVVGTMHPMDFAALRDQTGTYDVRAAGLPVACHDDGRRLTYILDLSAANDGRVSTGINAGVMPPTDLLRALEAIWLNDAAREPLAFGEATDRFFSRGYEHTRRRLTAYLLPDTLPPATRSVLTRFGKVHTGVGRDTLLPGERQAPEVLARSAKRLPSWAWPPLARLCRWGRRLNRHRLEAIEWWCARTLGPLYLVRAVWLLPARYPLGDMIPMLQTAAYVALIASIVAPGDDIRTAWRAALYGAAAVLLFALLAPAG